MKPRRVRVRILKVGHCRHPECIVMRGGSLRAVRFPALCALIIHPSYGPLLYDTGYSERFYQVTQRFPERLYRWITPVNLEPAEALPSQLARLGLAGSDIKAVLISHFHADHIAGLCHYDRARFIAMRGDYEAVLQLPRLRGLLHGYLPSLLPSDFNARATFAENMPRVDLPTVLFPFTTGFDLLGDRSLIAVPLPGHSRSQLGLLLTGDDDRYYFFLADACWTLKAVRENRRPAWPANLVMDSTSTYATTFAALQALHAKAGDELNLIPSHCDETWRSFGHAPD